MRRAGEKIFRSARRKAFVAEVFLLKFIACGKSIVAVRSPIKVAVCGVDISFKNARRFALKRNAEKAVVVCPLSRQPGIVALKCELVIDVLRQNKLAIEEFRLLRIVGVVCIENKVHIRIGTDDRAV